MAASHPDPAIQLWNDKSTKYDTLTKTFPHAYDLCATRLVFSLGESHPPVDGGRRLVFIDFGAGSGLSTECILRTYPLATVHLVEPAEDMLRLARQRLAHVSPAQLHYHAVTIQQVPIMRSKSMAVIVE